MKQRELTIKPSFQSGLMALPKSDTYKLWERIDGLISNPMPDGSSKKKLKNWDGVFRLKTGDYRVFYTFGDTWVRLLAIRRRQTNTYGAQSKSITYEVPHFIPTEGDDFDPDLTPSKPRHPTFQPDTSATSTHTPPLAQPLPVALSTELLERLRIPKEHWMDFQDVKTDEDLLEVDVPQVFLNRVMDHLFPQTVDALINQPDLVVKDTQALIKFKEGELHEFLLKLDPHQTRLCDWALQGPTMIKGGPGTGKSTVALFRIRTLLSQPGLPPDAKILFTTYTRSLTRMNEQLLDQLLTPDQRKRVTVCTLDQLVKRIHVDSRQDFQPEQPGQSKRCLKKLLTTWTPQTGPRFKRRIQAKRMRDLGVDYLLEEFRWVIQGRGVRSEDDYLTMPRSGRGVPLQAASRKTLWALHQAYLEALAATGQRPWEQLRGQALTAVTQGLYDKRFDFVVVDEAQDFTPVSLSLLAELAKTPQGIFLAADIKQSIHSRGVPMTTIHPRLDFKGRTRHLKRNYRSTGEIDRAAREALPQDDEDEAKLTECIHEGPMPVLIRCPPGPPETAHAASFIRQMSRHLRLRKGASAVLVPNQKLGKLVADNLNQQGLRAKYFKGSEIDLNSREIKVLTLHSAKGLEFPTVVICAMNEGTYPTPDRYGPEEYAERARSHARLLYVGMTRAMRGLMVIYPTDAINPALEPLTDTAWHILGDKA